MLLHAEDPLIVASRAHAGQTPAEACSDTGVRRCPRSANPADALKPTQIITFPDHIFILHLSIFTPNHLGAPRVERRPPDQRAAVLANSVDLG